MLKSPYGLVKNVRHLSYISLLNWPFPPFGRCLSLKRALWGTPRAVMWPLFRLSCRTLRTVWCRVPWTREEVPGSAGGTELQECAKTLSDIQRWTNITARMDFAGGSFHSSPFGGFEAWLFPVHLGIWSHSPAPWHFGRTRSCSWTFWFSSYIWDTLPPRRPHLNWTQREYMVGFKHGSLLWTSER